MWNCHTRRYLITVRIQLDGMTVNPSLVIIFLFYLLICIVLFQLILFWIFQIIIIEIEIK